MCLNTRQTSMHWALSSLNCSLAGARPIGKALRTFATYVIPKLPSIPLELDVPILVQDFVRTMLVTDPIKRPHSASECLRGLRALKHLHQWFCKQSAADVALIPMVESRPRTSRIEVSSPVTSLEANDPARWEKDGDYCRLRRTGDAKRRAR